MIAPFLDPDLVWDFRLPRVASINTSGHKYGLVHPGVGWVLWRDMAALPEELIFYVNYLGGEMPTFALNFSRPGAEVAAQYYNFFRLGRSGYRAVQQASRDVAVYLAGEVERLAEFELITRGDELPVFAFTTTDAARGWDLFAVSRLLGERGWQVPAYPFPENRQGLGRAARGVPQRVQRRPGRPFPGGSEGRGANAGHSGSACDAERSDRLPPLSPVVTGRSARA
jgi:glutamate decarboxylase